MPTTAEHDKAKLEAAIIMQLFEQRAGYRLFQYFPTEGPFRRELYAKHIEFFSAGARYKERLLMAANRLGKTRAGAYETTSHLTGIYPDWWRGRRFDHPVEVWACGTTSETTRDIVQSELLGPLDKPGTGMIPAHLILDTSRRPHGLPGSIESATIQHSSGGHSLLGLKTYEQGRKSFEGTAKHVIWDDEEPPADVYTEQLYRTLTTKGIVLTTFTPLQGMSEVVMGFLEPETDAASESKWWIQAGWDDVPHLDAAEKRALIATTPPYQIAARTKGEPSLGSGAIYPIAEADLKVPYRVIPDSWPKGYGMDVGWNRTAAMFFAYEVGSGTYYGYSEHYMGQGEPPSHALSIKAKGDWLTGVIDPAARGRNQKDGVQLLQSYTDLGLNLEVAANAVESGLMDVWTLMISGRFKVLESCSNWWSEFRKYHRDEKGHIVKKHDHLMDATRYFVVSGRDKMKAKPSLLKRAAPQSERLRGRTFYG